MQYPIEIDGFEGHQIAVETRGLIGRPRIYFDGLPVRDGPKKGQFILQRNDGLKVTAEVRPKLFDIVPAVIVEGEQLNVAESLRFYQVIWAALPMMLLFIGGLVGGAIGGVAFWFNLKVFRSDIHPAEKYLLSGSVSLIALFAVLFFIFIVATLVIAS